ncbi:MAG TPA: response regulator [Gemmatimonadaceae bacterium]|nr:response regulator [Gemmatimonadaceae bacterium]
MTTPSPATPEVASPQGAARATDDQVRVLLVDDDVRNLETLEVTLAESGCQLMRAQSADEALLLLLEHDFAAIVLDIRMPEMNGLELAQLIKSRKRNRDVPILFVTAYLLDEKDIVQGYRLGAASYLTKPLHPEILRSKIAVFADLYRKRRELLLANEALEHQVAERRKAEAALREVNQELERRVEERTADVVQANEVLRANQTRLRVALDAGRMGTWELDEVARTSRFDEVQCALLGLREGTTTLGEREFFRLIYPGDLSIVRRAMEAARAGAPEGGGAFEVEFRVVRPSDGALRWLLARGSVATESEGRVTRTAGVSFDITDRKQAEHALQEADRRKNAFLATLAHELRNPLAPISNAVHYLLLKGPAEPDFVAARDVIARQAQQLSRLVDDLLDISRITQDRLELRREPVELSRIVHAAVETSRPLIDVEQHTLTVEVPPEPIMLDADLTRLAQVISNLLNNAARYTEPRGHITLAATRDASGVTIRVQDTGIGIPAEILPQVFDMFVQGNGGRARASGGLGIGLALARRLVELHGGTISVRSAGPGSGSEFAIRLPVASVPAVDQPSHEEYYANHPRAALRVLVVDDNLDAADSLATLLRMMGNEVQTAHDGVAAVEAAAAYAPDVALLDVGLPKLDGYEVARRIRARADAADGHCAHRPVLIALTGFGQESDRVESFRAGFDHHLTKPADLKALMQLLAELSASRRSEALRHAVGAAAEA